MDLSGWQCTEAPVAYAYGLEEAYVMDIVVMDIEVHPTEYLQFEVGGQKVQVIGKGARRDPTNDPSVRSVMDGWLGGEKTSGRPPGRQRDAYDALEVMHRLIGTSGVFDTALNIVTEATRTFRTGAGVNTSTNESFGLLCVADKVARGKNFGQGGPPIKMLGPWGDPDRVSQLLDYSRFYHLSPSGMLAEGTGDIKPGAIWPSPNMIKGGAYSLVVSEADYEIRIAQALELIAPGVPSLRPRQETSLTYWFSANAILMAGAVYGACLSFGLD